MEKSKLSVLKKHTGSKLYDRNGTGQPLKVIKSVFIPEDNTGEPLLLLLCGVSNKDSDGKFDYCIFSDCLYGKNHVPSDSFGYGTKKKALEELKDYVFYSITNMWPWVVDDAWKQTNLLWKAKQ